MARALRTLPGHRLPTALLAALLAAALDGCVIDIDIAKHGSHPAIPGDGTTVYAA